MHTKYSAVEGSSLESKKDFEKEALTQVRSQFPDVAWAKVDVLGDSEYVETFEAPNLDTALKVGEIFCKFGKAKTEIFPL
jgi:hypothetical protein